MTLRSVARGITPNYPVQPKRIVADIFGAKITSPEIEARAGATILAYERKHGHRGKTPSAPSDQTSKRNPLLIARRNKMIEALRSGPMKAAELGRLLGICAATAASDLSVLRYDGLVEQARDKQSPPWMLTDAGRDYVPPPVPDLSEVEQRKKDILDTITGRSLMAREIAPILGLERRVVNNDLSRMRNNKLVTCTFNKSKRANVWRAVGGDT